jgi:hypothetical protein
MQWVELLPPYAERFIAVLIPSTLLMRRIILLSNMNGWRKQTTSQCDENE